MKLITNTDGTHKAIFRKLLKKARSIEIVSSYADSETLRFIQKRISKNKHNPKIRVILGGNFAITDPEALETIKREFPGRLYVAMPGQPVIFQSNIYLFKTKNNFHVLIGSAPCTEGGLETDMESTIYYKKSKKKKIWKQTTLYVNNLIQSPYVHPLTTRFIARYESYYKVVTDDPDQSFSSWKEDDVLISRVDVLRERLKEWRTLAKNSEKVVEIKDSYRLARKILNRLASQKLIPEEEAHRCMDQLVGASGEAGFWQVNGLQGSKSSIVDQFDVFRGLLRFVRENRHESPAFLFRGSQEYARQIKGVGVNMISEILISYEPKRLPKLNSGLIQKMIDAGSLSMKKSISKYDGEDYQKFTEIIWDYATILELKNMIEVDLFFDAVEEELDQAVDHPDPAFQVEVEEEAGILD